jgi:magnesium transporter
MLRQLVIRDGKLVEANGSPPSVLVYISPDEAERRYLVDQLRLDEHTLMSALDPDEQSRVEFEPEHAAIIFKRPKNYSSEDEFLFRVASTGMFLFADKLVVVLAEEAPLFDGKQFQRVSSPHDVLLKMMYRSIFHFIEHLKVMNAISSALEQQINTSMKNTYLLNMFTLEKSLVYYLNAINANAKVIGRLKNAAVRMGLSPENQEFLDDMIIENGQCYEQAEIYSQVLSSLMDARASIVGNNLNVLMKTLNIIMLGIMLPTLVVSIFSMNVKMPFWHEDPSAFWLILAGALVSAVGVAFIWWYKRL